MRILILGGAGFVGRRFSRRLANEGHEIWVVDNLISGLLPKHWAFPPENWSRFHFAEADCRDYFKEHRASEWDLIIHCAAIVGGRLNIEHDPLAVATDLSIDAEMFSWAVRSKPLPKVIYFSSSAVYPLELQTRQSHCALAEPLVNFKGNRISFPDRTYGWAKLSGEYLAQFAHDVYGLSTSIYRPFGGYGEDQDFNYPFPSIIRRVLNREDPIIVWGSGDQQRDFIYIEDIVDAVLHTYDKLSAGEALNLGTGVGTSFRELADAARDLLDVRSSIGNDASKPEGVFSRVADVHRLSQYWRYAGPLVHGISKVADFMKKQGLTGKAA